MYLKTTNLEEIVTQIRQMAHAPDALAVIFIDEKTDIDIGPWLERWINGTSP